MAKDSETYYGEVVNLIRRYHFYGIPELEHVYYLKSIGWSVYETGMEIIKLSNGGQKEAEDE
jgi:hypothetical protein